MYFMNISINSVIIMFDPVLDICSKIQIDNYRQWLAAGALNGTRSILYNEYLSTT